MEQRCEGRVAIVTGASRGIGAAIARRLGYAGATVVAAARTVDPDAAHQGSLAETIEAIRAHGGTAYPVQADISRSADRARLFAEAERIGPVDIVVNNGATTSLVPIADFDPAMYVVMFETHVNAPFEFARLALPGMRARGEGWLLNISSGAANHPQPPYPVPPIVRGMTVYGMCKAAQNRFTTGLAAEVYGTGIRVNGLSPSHVVATPGAHGIDTGVDFTGPEFPQEGPEWIAEAALALVTGDPDLTGRIAYSQALLQELGREPDRRFLEPAGA